MARAGDRDNKEADETIKKKRTAKRAKAVRRKPTKHSCRSSEASCFLDVVGRVNGEFSF